MEILLLKITISLVLKTMPNYYYKKLEIFNNIKIERTLQSFRTTLIQLMNVSKVNYFDTISKKIIFNNTNLV